MSESEFNLYLVLGLTGFFLNLGYGFLGALEALGRGRRRIALAFAAVVVAWALLSAGLVFFLYSQAMTHADVASQTRLVRAAMLLYPLLATGVWAGQRRLRRAGSG